LDYFSCREKVWESAFICDVKNFIWVCRLSLVSLQTEIWEGSFHEQFRGQCRDQSSFSIRIRWAPRQSSQLSKKLDIGKEGARVTCSSPSCILLFPVKKGYLSRVSVLKIEMVVTDGCF